MVDKSTYKILKHLYKKEREELNVLRALVSYDGPQAYSPQITGLLEDKMIAICDGDKVPDGEGGFKDENTTYFRITINGRAYIEQKNAAKFNFWLPYAITTIIAIASLVLTAVDILGKCQAAG